MDLHLVADATGAELLDEELRLLNPALLRSVTPNDPQFILGLPKGTGRNSRITYNACRWMSGQAGGCTSWRVARRWRTWRGTTA